MVNEVMAQAITGIDDELITDAFNATSRKHSRKPIYTIASVAACLVLIFTAIFLSAPKGTQIYLDGEKITGAPVLVSSPLSVASVNPRVAPELTVHLTVDFKSQTRIFTDDGNFSVCGINSDTLFYEGNNFTANNKTAEEELSLYWTVENPDTAKTYTLTLEGKKTRILNLKYDENQQNWTIFIEK